MAKNRYINTKFWDDDYIINLDALQKLLFLYFLTNPLTNICGVYEITLKRIAFDTGIDKDSVLNILKKFEYDNKIKYENGWIAIKNFIKHQKQSSKETDKINIGIKIELENAPDNLKKWLTLISPLKPLVDPLNYSNSNSNSNSNYIHDENNSEEKDYLNKSIDRIYSNYPSFCPINENRATGKCAANRLKIKRLLESGKYTEEKLIQIQEWYINNCKTHKVFIKNYGTFLNNIPEITVNKEVKKEKTDFEIQAELNRNTPDLKNNPLTKHLQKLGVLE